MDHVLVYITELTGLYDNGQSLDIFQTNLLDTINGNFTEFAKDSECLDNFESLS